MAFQINNGFSFNGYTYGDKLSGLRDSPSFDIKTSDSSAYDGSNYGRSRLAKRQLELRGIIMAESHDALRTVADAFMLAHSGTYPAKLVCYTDRYLWAQVDGDISREHSNARNWPWSVNFLCHDPYYYSVDSNVVNKTAIDLGDFNIPRTTTVTVGGTAFATPIISFVVDDYATGEAKIENVTTGEILSFIPTANGTYSYYAGPNSADTEVESRQYRFKLIKSTLNFTNLCTEIGDMRLLPGDNTIIISGASINAVSFAWRNRFV